VKRTYETNRLRLVRLNEEHAEKIRDFYIRNAAHLDPWEPLREPGFDRVESHRRTLAFERRATLNGMMVRFWIFKKEDTELEHPIGSAALTNIVRGVFKSCYLGYKIDNQEINNGYMTEALEKVLEIAFEELELHRVEANIMPRNHRSLRVIEKLGFEQEGLSKRYLKINGTWEDHYRFALIHEEEPS
jgi:ribosomal-protein-alanine N-acetyltransferase